MPNTEDKKTVLFYTSVPRIFKTTLIGYLHEISQKYPVILLSEKLDPETEKIIRHKKFFPKIEKIIPVCAYKERKGGIFAHNRYFYKLAKRTIKEHRPDIVISTNDLCLFEMYLMRFAKKAGALNVCFQGGLHVEAKKSALRTYLMKIYSDFPAFLPVWLKSMVLRIKRYGAHFFYYWILPLLVFQPPFRGKSSIALWKWVGGMRDCDYLTVFSKREYDIHIRDGVAKEKINILAHPFEGRARSFLKQIISGYKKEPGKKIAVLMLPVEKTGIRNSDKSLITEQEIEKIRTDAVKLIAQKLNSWQIFIKPHPAYENIEKITEIFEPLSQNIKVAGKDESAEKYNERADLITALPSPNTTTLFIAFLQNPDKPILALDLSKEFLGDIYRDFEGIEYIDNKEKLTDILEDIKNNNYGKKIKNLSHQTDFSSAIDVLEGLWRKRYTNNVKPINS